MANVAIHAPEGDLQSQILDGPRGDVSSCNVQFVHRCRRNACRIGSCPTCNMCMRAVSQYASELRCMRTVALGKELQEAIFRSVERVTRIVLRVDGGVKAQAIDSMARPRVVTIAGS